MNRRGWTCVDALAVLVVGVVLAGVLGAGVNPKQDWISISTANLGQIGFATAMYRNDMRGYFPEVLSYRRGSIPTSKSGGLEGWCTWSAWGKNNSAWWAGKTFDVEAADRPANGYLMLGRTFGAPPPPATLPANDPQRLKEAYPLRDPGDVVTFQRAWPNSTAGVTGYNDVGTSYLWNAAWWGPISQQVSGFEAAFKEGTRRLAVGQGVSPSRFIWTFDQYGDLLANISNRNYKRKNGYGDVNFAMSLFYDGHARYLEIKPGFKSTPEYSVVFE